MYPFRIKILLLLPFLACFSVLAHADPVVTTQPIVVSTAPAELPPAAQTGNLSALDVKAEREAKWRAAAIPLMPYKPNYFLPYSHTLNGRIGGGLANDNGQLENTEAQFQFSFQIPVITGLFWGHGAFQVAYTQLSFYQVYNGGLSAPFRESDYEPEAQLAFETPLRLFGWAIRNVNFAYDHQSNGRSSPESRSWNRVYGQVILGRGNGSISLRPWFRIHEPADTDDNPDIEHYMGNVEVIGSYSFYNTVASVLLRDNFRSGASNKGAVNFTWSFPLVRRLRGFLYYFNGYGETLIDYNHPSSRLGLGFSFSDWL
jgi:phospholipase A1/A2